MKITITNLKNKQSVRFLNQEEWDKNYKSYCTPNDVAIEHHDYKLKADGYTGWDVNPTLVPITNKGINQDGETYLGESYNDRDVTWQCVWVGGIDTLYLSEVFHQDSNLLQVDWEHDGRHYQNKGYINGTYENGVFDMTIAPFFSVVGSGENLKFDIPKYTGMKPFLPMKMPQVFISNKTTHTWESDPINIGISVDCKITLRGTFNNIRISNSLNNGWFYIESKDIIKELVIDSKNEEVLLNGNIITDDLYDGSLITFSTGINTLVFDIAKRLGAISVEVEYDSLVGSVN